MSNPAPFNTPGTAINGATQPVYQQQQQQSQQPQQSQQQTFAPTAQPLGRPPPQAGQQQTYMPVAGPSTPTPVRPMASQQPQQGRPPMVQGQQQQQPQQTVRPPGQAQIVNVGTPQQRPPTLGYGGQPGSSYNYNNANNGPPPMSAEERARLQSFHTRLNIANTYVVKRPMTLGGRPPKRQEFVGEQDLVLRSAEIVKQHGMKIDADATAYLALAAERKVREIMDDLLAAKAHRVNTAIHRPPPLEDGHALWSHAQTSDPAALLAALARANEESEKQNRKRRMDRLDIELKEKARRDAGLAAAALNEPSTPQVAPETPDPRKKPKKDMKASLLETSVKQSNQTALRSIGSTPKYAWMTGGASPASFAARKKQKQEAAETPVKASGSGWARTGSKLAKASSPDPVKIVEKPVSRTVRADTAGGVTEVSEEKAIMVKDVRIVAAARGMGRVGERMMASIAQVSAERAPQPQPGQAIGLGGPSTGVGTA